MTDIKGQLLPVYVMADESASMSEHMAELNEGLASLHEALLAEPMTAAKVRFSVLGFSHDVQVRLKLADLREVAELPGLVPRQATNYQTAFDDLRARIPGDIATLKAGGYQVHRPAVFFLSDGQPNQGGDWKSAHARLTDRGSMPAAPNIVAFGIGQANPETILHVATSPEFAFVAAVGTEVGAAIAKFSEKLTKSVVHSARAVAAGSPTLVVERPEGFAMAIDLV